MSTATSPRKRFAHRPANPVAPAGRRCYYADKSGYAGGPGQAGTYYFLSCPRRFGQSLFLDTLKELFEGNAALFKGLVRRNPAGTGAKAPGHPHQLWQRCPQGQSQLGAAHERNSANQPRAVGIVRPAELPASDAAAPSALIAQAHRSPDSARWWF